ncbi:ABC transporter permease [Arcanobacterium hippocoleae]|uniref:Transport permease protein n=1 Tax=Arcanobacterium hippocoleae TaxID=149017 RepID=A0ABU1T284_9ACTO|nr:ABC transporter permease [Arcanobacterium hippocoleae]MDR6939492.1 ABC-2 type transport system permease protein [Arcanobacterium hippocoleae]
MSQRAYKSETNADSRSVASWFHSLAIMMRLEWLGAELHTWQRWVSLAVLPMTYLGLLGVGLASAFGDGTYLNFVVPGAIVMQALSGLNRVVARTVTERRWGLAAFKLQSGVPKSAYLFGLIFPGIAIFAVQALILLVFAAILGVRYSLLTIAVMMFAAVLGALTWSLLSFVVASAVRNYQTRDFILTITIMPLTFAAPVFYPLDSAPLALKMLALINPLTYQVHLVRGATYGQIEMLPAFVCLGTLVMAAVMALFAARKMQELSFEG